MALNLHKETNDHKIYILWCIINNGAGILLFVFLRRFVGLSQYLNHRIFIVPLFATHLIGKQIQQTK